MTPRAAITLARPGSGHARSVAEARRALAAKFRAAGIDSPELDARILVGHALGLDHAALAAAGARCLDAGERDAIAVLAARRLTREPVARIVGRKEFWSLPLRVDATTLVPRPETETVVEAALGAIDAQGPRAIVERVADLGTGCGALLLALIAELPKALGIGTDTSLGALAVAHDNARRLGLTRAKFVACDMAAALGGPFDLIVSNPPYIASGDIAALASEVRDFDPRPALDGGPDGLDCYRAIAATVPALLRPGGVLVVELGAGQAQTVAALFSAAGLAPSPSRTDLQGVPRALLSRKGMRVEQWPPAKKRKKALGISAGTD
ncbi:MAG TPA: peptide chain release factor N(5)-glutamine methyltransferase [Xanthobacteraceae bacterium]|nr:peptide chain release factor N(5)-glutamine methyltransferase [Xanthobacteraceae bacterium]